VILTKKHSKQVIILGLIKSKNNKKLANYLDFPGLRAMIRRSHNSIDISPLYRLQD
jgi:hypothetical protein